MVSSGISGVAGNYHQHPTEAEENAGDGEQSGPCAVDRHGEQQRPDGRGGVEHGGDVAGHGAFTPGKEGEGEGVIEQGNGQQPGQQAARRQLFAAELQDGPEQGSAQCAAQQRHPERGKRRARNPYHEERNSP